MRKEISDQLKKEKFLEKIINMKTLKEVKKAFKEEGIDISDAEIKDIGSGIYSFLGKLSKLPDSKSLNELSDEEVEKISGGAGVIISLIGLGGAILTYVDKARQADSKVALARLKLRQEMVRGQQARHAQESSYTWKGIIHDNPKTAAVVGVVGILSAAYVAKTLINAIKDGNLMSWFEVDDEEE